MSLGSFPAWNSKPQPLKNLNHIYLGNILTQYKIQKDYPL